MQNKIFMNEQKYLFDIIRKKIPDSQNLVDVVEKLLGIGNNSAYRRIRGEKELTIKELCILCKKFNISFDEVLNYKSGQSAMFNYTPIDLYKSENYVLYLKRSLEKMTALTSAQKKEIYVTAQDIPFYHLLNYPELTLFKLYAWNTTINRTPVSYCEFCNNLDKDAIMPIFKQMVEEYQNIPSKEIWTNQTIDNILRLLEYHFETGAFEKKETAILLLNQLTDLIDTVAKYTDDGCKGGDTKVPFLFYLSIVDLENSFMLVKKDENMSCILKLYTINGIVTENEAFCRETEKWINDLILKSTLISKTSSKEKFRFFQTTKNKIDELRNKINVG